MGIEISKLWNAFKDVDYKMEKGQLLAVLGGSAVIAFIAFVVLLLLKSFPVIAALLIFCFTVAGSFLMLKKLEKKIQDTQKVLKEGEEAMRQARLQAEITSRSRMEFLANMSHELRTPLNSIIGFSAIIKDEVMGPLGIAAYKEYATNIYDSGHHLLKNISEILEVSKIETGNRELNTSNFKLSKVLDTCLMIMTNRIEESGVSLKTDIPEDLPEILGEQLSIKQILLNLIGNAFKFTPKGGKVEVSASVNPANGEMVINISDTGIGMTDDEIKKIMQPFGKVDNSLSSARAGAGLGLMIVNALVKLHGGQLILTSKKGVGTTAKVILPSFRVLSRGAQKAKA